MEYFTLDRDITFRDINTIKCARQQLAVIAHIEDNQGRILLQQHGIASHDEKGLFEDIGGKVDREDSSLSSALQREIYEEAGCDIKLQIGRARAIYRNYKKNTDIDWLFVVYFVRYLGGNIMIMEPDKCLGYKFFSYQELLAADNVSASCKYLTKQIKTRS